jgi:hypothetical protein
MVNERASTYTPGGDLFRSTTTKAARWAAATVAAFSLTMVPLAPAQATTVSTNTAGKIVAASKASTNEKTIRSKLAAAGVSKKTQNSLIAKLRAGKKWDAATKGKKPRKTKKYTSGSYKYTKQTYADGSILLYRVKNWPAPTSANFVALDGSGTWSDCKSYTTSHYYITAQGCDVAGSLVGLYWINFTFDYGAAQGSRGITGKRNLSVTGGFITNPRFEVQSEWDVRAYADVVISVQGNTFTYSTYLGIQITDSGGFYGYTAAG